MGSSDAVATMHWPSGLNATLEAPPVCPCKGAISLPVAASHRRAVLSTDAVTMRCPSGLNATLETPPVCPCKVAISFPVARVPQARGGVP
jgi:hypothetical protein